MHFYQLILALGLLVVLAQQSLGDDSAYLTKLFTDDELLNWEPPEEYKKNFTYYWSGYDEEGKPFWVGEFGKWDIRTVVERGGEAFETFDKYVDQLVASVLRSINATTTEDIPVTTVMGIADMEDYNFKQISSQPTVRYILKKIQAVIPALAFVDYAYVINTNYIAERLVNIIRPILGPVFERIEVHGLSRARWIASILQKVPRDQLPSWYGGTDSNFKPIKVYG